MNTLPIFRTIAALTILAAIALPGVAQAQDSQFKIGVVDLKKVFDQYDKQKQLYIDLKTERDTLQKPIDELSKSIEANKTKYDKGKEDKSISEADLVVLKEKIEADYSEYQLKIRQSQEKIDRREKAIFEEIIVEIKKSVEEIGAKENYHLVFDGGKSRTNSLLYYSTTLNMTQKIIDHLNSK